MESWKQIIKWSELRSLNELTQRGNRDLVPEDAGYYVFVAGYTKPRRGSCLYIGRALSEGGLRQRLRSYLRSSVDLDDLKTTKHKGKRLIFEARILGLSKRQSSTTNTTKNDGGIYLCWWPYRPISATRARMLEYAMIHAYEPKFNTYDDGRSLDFQLNSEFAGSLR